MPYSNEREPKTMLITTDGTTITRKGKPVKHYFDAIDVVVEYEHDGEIKRDVVAMDDLVDAYLHFKDILDGNVDVSDITVEERKLDS